MFIKTANGKLYLINNYQGSLRALIGTRELVIKKVLSMEVGQPLELEGNVLDMFYREGSSFYYRSSTPIVSINGTI